MLEDGIAKLVQSNPAVAAIATMGGFVGQLPENFTLPSWTQRSAGDYSEYGLQGERGLNRRRLQIDCYGSPAEAVSLAEAIDAVLSGYKGTLPDDDSTLVYGCFQSDVMDFFDSGARTLRRMLEYRIWFFRA